MMTGTTSVDEALERIAKTDATLQAWAFVATSAAEIPAGPGPLAGVPFGVKDIIDVAKMPTAFGLWREHRKARIDAWCVAVLRAAGAVPVGKTRTTAHAFRDPAPTVNPLDAARTPGGSSAGSAASVAAGHVPFALGTQTIGSILRPAAYCGVVGFKPTYGEIPAMGVAPLSPSLDHVGVIGRDVGIVTDVARVLLPGMAYESIDEPRIAVVDGVLDPAYAPETVAAIRGALEKLAAAGFAVAHEKLPPAAAEVADEVHTIVAYEAHACLQPLLAHALPTELRLLLTRGAEISRDDYVHALERRETLRHSVTELLARYDAVIVPGADVAPPRSTTGDGSPFAAWSSFGVPAIAIPIPGTAPASLALQVVAPRGEDGRLLAVAAAIEKALA
jgi:amidase